MDTESPHDETKEAPEPSTPNISAADKYFIDQRDLILQDINNTMDSILNNLNTLNISLESSIAVGKEFESVADLWKTFYDGLETDAEVPANSQEDELQIDQSHDDVMNSQKTETEI
ncbi:hypothetical protein HG535_0C01990 [Zygotorulaspora mrakii]|uniref:DASH complex subunit DAD1 n=1 Tax=Zygotorulaspora mrakii TaxID=42260 RepID=A0A7H9AZR0_ZYGMR|nr:uncharacterized protein HG535_0C01990 [Zygotorulaspora mrakii]QLG71850.1 hypothetical protein HG535_0C01990 [Zygotorulaspora mrakii]